MLTTNASCWISLTEFESARDGASNNECLEKGLHLCKVLDHSVFRSPCYMSNLKGDGFEWGKRLSHT